LPASRPTRHISLENSTVFLKMSESTLPASSSSATLSDWLVSAFPDAIFYLITQQRAELALCELANAE